MPDTIPLRPVGQRTTLSHLLASIDLVALASEYVTLRRHGQEYTGLCPFHNEKTPSFTVNPEKGVFYCHGCHEGGNVLSFIEKIEGIDRQEALLLLAEKSGVHLEESRVELEFNSKYSVRLRALCGVSEAFYINQLRGSEGILARRYLENRGITETIAGTFRLGYSPRDPRQLPLHLKECGFTPEEMVAAGVVGEKHLDPLRDRLVFPIQDQHGQTVGFGARSLGNQVKYLNTPETSLFQKGKTFYLLPHARKTIQARGVTVLVEGYLDAILAHHYGFAQTLATMGTAITASHLTLLRRLTQRVILCLDADPAGVRAIEQTASLFQENGMEVQVASLPEGMDPDAYLRHFGPDAFQEILENAVSVPEFRMSRILRSRDLSRRNGRIEALEACVQVLAALDSPIERDQYTTDLARMWAGSQLSGEELQRKIEAVRQEIQRRVVLASPRKTFRRRTRIGSPSEEECRRRLEREILTFLVGDPSLSFQFGVVKEDFIFPEHQAIFDALGKREDWISYLEPKEATLATQIVKELDADFRERNEDAARECLHRLRQFEQRDRLEELKRSLESGNLEDLEEYQALCKEIKAGDRTA